MKLFLPIIIFFLISNSFCITPEDSVKNAPRQTNNNQIKKSIVKSFGIKLGATETYMRAPENNITTDKRIVPKLAAFARLFDMKYLSQEIELFPSQIAYYTSYVNLVNVDYTFQLHGKSKGIHPYIELGPAVGIYCGSNIFNSDAAKKYRKNICVGCKWGMGLTYSQWRVSPLLELGGIKYLTPIYQSKNEGDFVKRTYKVNSYSLLLGLSYSI
jgi:hypothetical protein